MVFSEETPKPGDIVRPTSERGRVRNRVLDTATGVAYITVEWFDADGNKTGRWTRERPGNVQVEQRRIK